MVAPIASASPAAPAADPARQQQLRQAAEAFEALFLRQMIGGVRQAKLTQDDLFSSNATEQFQSMADSQLADTMANKSSFGIAELLLKQFGNAVK